MTAMLSEGLPEALIERLGHNLSNDDWHKFGLHLGFSNSQLEELYPSYQNMGKCSALAWMLRKWDRIAVDTWGIKKTLRFLGSNLNLIDRRDLVEDLSLQIFEGDNVDLMNDCEEISKKLQHVCLCWKWSSNIDERLMSRIRKWQDDSKLFYKTRVFSHIKKIVEDKGIVIVTGKQGDGKTFLAEQLLLHFLYLGYELVLVNSPKEWKQRWNPNIKQIIFIDDVFGKTRAFPFGELEQWVLCGQEMSECIEGGVTKVISTVRDYIHRDTQGVVRNVEIFRHVVNVSSDEWNLTFGEKYGMLENHLQHFEVLIDKITLRKIALNDYIQGFPLRCRLFFSDQRLKRMGNNFFLDHLPQVLFDELNYLEQTEKMKYLALVMLLLSDGVLHEDTLRSSNQGRMTKVMRLLGLKSGKPHENLFETLRHEFDLPQSAGLDKLHEAVNDLTGTYIIKVGRMYRFVHECVAEAIACTFGNSRKHQTLYIALCSASELQQRVHISSSDVVPNVEMCRVVPADVSKTALATRLTDEIEQGMQLTFLLIPDFSNLPLQITGKIICWVLIRKG